MKFFIQLLFSKILGITVNEVQWKMLEDYLIYHFRNIGRQVIRHCMTEHPRHPRILPPHPLPLALYIPVHHPCVIPTPSSNSSNNNKGTQLVGWNIFSIKRNIFFQEQSHQIAIHTLQDFKGCYPTKNSWSMQKDCLLKQVNLVSFSEQPPTYVNNHLILYFL